MTKDEYKQLKPEGRSLFHKVVLGISIVGLIAIGGFKAAKHFYDKHQNRTEVEITDLREQYGFLQIEYTRYKDGEPKLNFEWRHHGTCCEEVITKYSSWQRCVINGVVGSTVYKGIDLESNNRMSYDYDCDRKIDEICDYRPRKCSPRNEKDLEQFETADQNLAEAERLINEEIDLEKTVNEKTVNNRLEKQ